MKVKFISIARRIIQVITAVLINSAPDYFNTGKIYKGPQKQFCVPFLNCQNCPTARTSCPIHFIQNVLTRHKNEGVNISVYGFILVGAIIMMVGRAPCAWLCPFGLFQDLLARINRKKFSLPRWAYKIRYFVLGFLVIGLPFLTGFHWYSKICPSGTLTSKAPWIIVHPPFKPFFYLKISILILTIVAVVYSGRFFCKAICPMGAILGYFNRWSLIKIEVDENCKKCGHCKKNCPMDIAIYENPNSADCIRCLNCLKCKHVHLKIMNKEIQKN